MYLADYHTHTHYSFDGMGDPEEMCRRAVELGLQELAFTDHMDIFTVHSYDYILNCRELYPELLACREKWADKLRVVIGAELGQPMANPAAADAFLQDHPELDFVIGSIHQMENDLDVYYYNFRRRDPRDVYNHYLDWLLDLAENYDYDVIGHITYPLRYIEGDAGIPVDTAKYRDMIADIFKAVIARGKGIELNTSGYRQTYGKPFPDGTLLKLYRDLGGKILTLGSDAHRPEDVAGGIAEGAALARSVGFDRICYYLRHDPCYITI